MHFSEVTLKWGKSPNHFVKSGDLFYGVFTFLEVFSGEIVFEKLVL